MSDETDYDSVQAEDGWGDKPSYLDYVDQAWPYEMVSHEKEGHYTGAHHFLLRRDDGNWGTCTIGFGSCSGCDPLLRRQRHDNVEATIRELFENHRQRIAWKGKDDMIGTLEGESLDSWHSMPREEFAGAIRNYKDED